MVISRERCGLALRLGRPSHGVQSVGRDLEQGSFHLRFDEWLVPISISMVTIFDANYDTATIFRSEYDFRERSGSLTASFSASLKSMGYLDDVTMVSDLCFDDRA